MVQIGVLLKVRLLIYLGVATFLFAASVGHAYAIETAESENALRQFLQIYLFGKPRGDLAREFENEWPTRYSAATLSLNDEIEVYLVFVSGRAWCGSGGCTVLLLKRNQASFKVINRFSLARLPIYVLPTKTHGWRDLVMFVQGGGIIDGYHAVLHYDGKKYPSNPSMEPRLQSKDLLNSALEVPLEYEGQVLLPQP